MDVTLLKAPKAGVQLVQVLTSTIPNKIEAGDLIRVDFDQHAFCKDGYYVLGVGDWMGVRRLDDTFDGVRVQEHNGDRVPLPSHAAIFGYVDKVYTPRNAFNWAELSRG